ncbi:MAG: MBL fold metallo-hydrolase [Clostridia bacterium]|nr:MBL fold metallo-hydrolase [Clostridia bacterium]
MKKYSRPLLALLLSLIFLICCSTIFIFADTSNFPTTVAGTDGNILMVNNGKINFTIVRSSSASQNVLDAAEKLSKAFHTQFGSTPSTKTDFKRAGAEPDHSSLEILLGNTSYAESKQALTGLGYGDYIICFVGNKLVINAASDTALDKAVDVLIKQIKRLADENSLAVPADFNITASSNKAASALPLYAGGELSSIYDAGTGCTLIVISATSAKEYSAYRKRLEQNGYTLYADNEIVSNLFVTYTDNRYVVNVGYYAAYKETRITVESLNQTSLPIRETENTYNRLVEPKLTMIGLEFTAGGSTTENGMSFIFQLADGSYIVIDGGFNRGRDVGQIYSFMRKNAPDPNNITIAAWIITHSHSDHYGAFAYFAKAFSKRVTLENFIANFPSDDARIEGGLADEGGYGATLISCAKRFSGCKIIKAHVGQKFYLRDAEIEILYTLESYAPNVLSYFNTSSLVFTVDIADQRFLFLGDASNDALTITTEMFDDYLESDFVQTAHHGYTTGSSAYAGVVAAYRLAAAPVVLWPVGDKDYATMYTRTFSAYLQNASSTKELLVAGSKNITLNLPYRIGTSY